MLLLPVSAPYHHWCLQVHLQSAEDCTHVWVTPAQLWIPVLGSAFVLLRLYLVQQNCKSQNIYEVGISIMNAVEDSNFGLTSVMEMPMLLMQSTLQAQIGCSSPQCISACQLPDRRYRSTALDHKSVQQQRLSSKSATAQTQFGKHRRANSHKDDHYAKSQTDLGTKAQCQARVKSTKEEG